MEIGDIQIIEKPDWVSWDDIHEVLMASHADNREKGIVMSYPLLPGNEIKKKLGENGKMLVAIAGGKVVATSAIMVKKLKLWCGSVDDVYADCVFASVLPEYNGMGIFKKMDLMREDLARRMGLNKMIGDTHEKNQHRLRIAKKAGYKFVDFRFYKDHCNVVMVKWLDGCPYSDFQCNMHFLYRKFVVKLKFFLKH